MTQFSIAQMTIGGESRAGASSFGVVNPATEEVFAEAPICSKAQLDEAFEAAAHAQRDWARDDTRRRALLAAAADALLAAEDRIAPILTAEQGKPLRDARNEVRGAARWISYFATLDVPTEEAIDADERGRRTAFYSPLGVIAAITPWNAPIALLAWKLGPALRAGNTMVIKPSPYTPLSTLLAGEVLSAVLPPGVLNVVCGGDDVGKWMTAHATPRKISFTGSVEGGKSVAASAAADLKRVTLELGGNDPAILLDDFDVEANAQALFWSAFYNNGQICGIVKRLYAPEAMVARVGKALAAVAAGVKVGNGADAETTLGPINNQPQFEKLLGFLDDARAQGAKAIVGGVRKGERGYFLPPTILTGASDGDRIVDEEQFGPILPIVAYADVDQVVGRANASVFGLGASVWSADAARARTVAQQLNSGSIWINSHAVVGPGDPFGGARWSGIGLEGGLAGLRGFCQMHVLHEKP